MSGAPTVDWLRARRGATVVVPLSVRARPMATLAVPISWDEVDGVVPDQWTIRDVDDVIDRSMPADVLSPLPLPTEEIVVSAREAGVDLDTPFDRFGRRW